MATRKNNIYQAVVNKYLADENDGGPAGASGPGRIVKKATPIKTSGTQSTAHGLSSRSVNVSGAGKPITRGAAVMPTITQKKKKKRNSR